MSIPWPCELQEKIAFPTSPVYHLPSPAVIRGSTCRTIFVVPEKPLLVPLLTFPDVTPPQDHDGISRRAAGAALFQPRHHLSRVTSSASSRDGQGFNQPFIQLIKASMSSSRFAGCPQCEQCGFPKSLRVWQLHKGSPAQGKPESWYGARAPSR